MFQPDSTLVDKFIEAQYYDHFTDITEELLGIIIHVTQSNEGPRAEDKVAQFFSHPGSSHVSTHYVLSADGIDQCVPENRKAYAAGPTGNRTRLHLEVVGWVTWTREQWCNDPVLPRLAALIADILKRKGWPADFLDAAGLRAGKLGIGEHSGLTEAFPGETNHKDPGVNFPMDHVLQMVRA